MRRRAFTALRVPPRQNDVAILVLQEPAPCVGGSLVLPRLDPREEGSSDGAELVVAGWGATNRKGTKYPTTMLEAAVTLHSSAYCREKYGAEIKTGMICAGSPGKDSCSGDSGGPLFIPGDAPSDPATIVGVVSWGGAKCADDACATQSHTRDAQHPRAFSAQCTYPT